MANYRSALQTRASIVTPPVGQKTIFWSSDDTNQLVSCDENRVFEIIGSGGQQFIRRDIFTVTVNPTSPSGVNMQTAWNGTKISHFVDTGFLPTVYFNCLWETYDQTGALIDTGLSFADDAAMNTYFGTLTTQVAVNVKCYILLENEKPKLKLTGRNQGYWQLKGTDSYYKDRTSRDLSQAPASGSSYRANFITAMRVIDPQISLTGEGVNFTGGKAGLHHSPPEPWIGNSSSQGWHTFSAASRSKYSIIDDTGVAMNMQTAETAWGNNLGSPYQNHISHLTIDRNGNVTNLERTTANVGNMVGEVTVSRMVFGSGHYFWVVKPASIDTIMPYYTPLAVGDKVLALHGNSVKNNRLYDMTLNGTPNAVVGMFPTLGSSNVKRNRLGSIYVEDFFKTAHGKFQEKSVTRLNNTYKFIYGQNGIFTESYDEVKVYKQRWGYGRFVFEINSATVEN